MPRFEPLYLREVAPNTRAVSPLGDEIRRARERLQMTQPQLAEAVGVSESTISNWERGRSVPKNRLTLVREVLRMDQPTNGDSDDHQPRGRLLAEATITECLERVLELYNAALRSPAQACSITYHPGSPDPTGLIPGPATRTERLHAEQSDASRPADEA